MLCSNTHRNLHQASSRIFGFLVAIESSLRLAPLGLPWPCSQDWTVFGEILRYLANTACETLSRARRLAISFAESCFGGSGSVVVRRSLRAPFACSIADSSPVFRLSKNSFFSSTFFVI